MPDNAKNDAENAPPPRLAENLIPAGAYLFCGLWLTKSAATSLNAISAAIRANRLSTGPGLAGKEEVDGLTVSLAASNTAIRPTTPQEGEIPTFSAGETYRTVLKKLKQLAAAQLAAGFQPGIGFRILPRRPGEPLFLDLSGSTTGEGTGGDVAGTSATSPPRLPRPPL